jgi:hypothetical protein
MALVGVAITKSTTFRDATQEFSNVYHYGYTGLNPIPSLADSIASAITTIEKTFHSSSVAFVRYKVWSAGGSIADNQMISQGTLTGFGAAGNITNFDKERAVLVQWPAGVDSRNHPVTLKKWYHCCGMFGAVTFGAGQLDNTTSISSGNRTAIQGYVDDLTELVVNASAMQLMAASGREPEGGPIAHKYLEHHQLGDMWRS